MGSAAILRMPWIPAAVTWCAMVAYQEVDCARLCKISAGTVALIDSFDEADGGATASHRPWMPRIGFSDTVVRGESM